jgi:hypothetical protein
LKYNRGMAKKRKQHPLDVTTGRLAFTPVLRTTGDRLDLEVDGASFPQSNAPGFHGHTQDLKTGTWYAVYGKECDIPGCHCDAWVEEVPTPVSPAGRPLAMNAVSDDHAGEGLADELCDAIRSLLTIQGVEGIGQPVTVLTPDDLPPDLLGFIERLRGGPIELDEEMILLNLPPRRQRCKELPAADRLRRALLLLGQYALDQGVCAEALSKLFDEARRKLCP